ncbi:hypothetical protein LCG56_25920 [Pseudomonas cannabina pv. alisalensis]|uniref:hypothetical protein n=1 Tax=Pseudomonas cannabina TaxID=86840 RepID=UPI0002094E5F|nr:hypothetical protein [Pseudomonas cannabina]UBY97331.1 hypothetical protein LCG56_25920 [Pseudomonas cannabina pv. alisalensis]
MTIVPMLRVGMPFNQCRQCHRDKKALSFMGSDYERGMTLFCSVDLTQRVQNACWLEASA